MIAKITENPKQQQICIEKKVIHIYEFLSNLSSSGNNSLSKAKLMP